MEVLDLKQEAHRMIDRLTEVKTWDDLAYHMAVRASIERGLADSKAGRLISREAAKKQLSHGN